MENFSCSMSGQGFCPYEKNGGECIVEGNCTNKIIEDDAEVELLKIALRGMIDEGYFPPTATIEDLKKFTNSMFEGTGQYAQSKLEDWDSEFEE